MSADIRLRPTKPPLDARPLARRVGLLILATDHTSEPDYARMVAGERIGVYVARLAYANPTTPENLAAMQPALGEAAGLILPDEPLDAICYSCTSASVVIGDEAVEEAIAAGKPGVPVVTPPMAAATGLKALGASRISVLTPYTVETSRPMADYFAAKGFDIASFTCLGFEDDREMARISPMRWWSLPARRSRRTPRRCSSPARRCAPHRWRRGSRMPSAARSSPAIRLAHGNACACAATTRHGRSSAG